MTANALYRMRLAVMGRPRLRGVLCSLAVSAAAISLLLALDGRWSLAALCLVAAVLGGWFGALWFGFHTPDGYWMATVHTWEAWTAEVGYAKRRYESRKRKLTDSEIDGLEEAAREYDTTVQDACRRTTLKLERAWRPAAASPHHEALIAVVAKYSSEFHAMREAVAARDERGAEAARARVLALQPEVEKIWADLRVAVKLGDRWPLPEQPSAA